MEELSYHLKGAVPFVDLLSMSLYDVVNWVISRHVYGGSLYNSDDYDNGMWLVELWRASSKDADGDQLYRRCAYSFPFKFCSGSYEGQVGGISKIENDVTRLTLDRMNGGSKWLLVLVLRFKLLRILLLLIPSLVISINTMLSTIIYGCRRLS